MITVKYTEDNDADMINTVIEIDSIVFPAHLQGTFQEVYGRFCKNRDSYVLLYDKNRIIGYLCMFPVKDELYREISSSDKFYDSNIPCEMIEQYKPGNTYKLYAISTAILPGYQGKGLSKHLIGGFRKYLTDKRKENILFSSVLSTAVTTGGDYLLRTLGFEKKKTLQNDYALYELLIDDVYYEKTERELSSYTNSFQ